MQLRPLSTAIFDHDGVIVATNRIKSAAFEFALAGEPKAEVEAFLKWHRAHGGINRRIKLARFYAARPAEQQAALVERALGRFNERVEKGLASCAEVEGVRAWLDRLGSAGVHCHVVSGADATEVERVLMRLDLARHFKSILGGPVDKVTHLQHLSECGQLIQPAVFFGDAAADLEAAEAHRLEFVFVAAVSDWDQGRAYARARGHAVIDDFRGLTMEST